MVLEKTCQGTCRMPSRPTWRSGGRHDRRGTRVPRPAPELPRRPRHSRLALDDARRGLAYLTREGALKYPVPAWASPGERG